MFGEFGNKVKIKSTPATEEKGLAGKTGEVYGETTPSLMDFEIIGKPKEDYAINVHFEDLGKSYWFDSDLLEYLDNGQDSVMTLDGIDKKWTKEDGGWLEENTTSTTTQKDSSLNSNESESTSKWWKFWKH